MEELFQLRRQEHELSMRQMVEEIHRGQLNNGQAAIKFEVNCKTVKHWLDKLEGEATTASDQTQTGPEKSSCPASLKKVCSLPAKHLLSESSATGTQ